MKLKQRFLHAANIQLTLENLTPKLEDWMMCYLQR